MCRGALARRPEFHNFLTVERTRLRDTLVG